MPNVPSLFYPKSSASNWKDDDDIRFESDTDSLSKQQQSYDTDGVSMLFVSSPGKRGFDTETSELSTDDNDVWLVLCAT
jgi:hypothetical protein